MLRSPRLRLWAFLLLLPTHAPAEPADPASPAPSTVQLRPELLWDEGTRVTLYRIPPGLIARYTLDGHDPEAQAGPYLAPLDLPTGGTVKARYFTPDRQSVGEVASLTVDAPEGITPLPSTLLPCTQDRDWPRYDWADRHAAVCALARTAHPALVFLGDSITQMFGGEPHDRPQPGLAVWNAHFGARPVLNLGFGYDRVENALWRVQHGELEGVQARWIVLLIGTNNLECNSPGEIAAGVEELCREVHARQPLATILLHALFPRGPRPEDPARARVAAANRLLAALEGKHQVRFVDFGARFLEADGTLSPEVMSDSLHPTTRGYEIWAQELEQWLAR